MPGFYSSDEYDLVGFIVGVVEKSKVVDGSDIHEGDLLIGLASSGLHTNGYSLVRKVCLDMEGIGLDETPKGLERTLGEELLMPHRSYLDAAKVAGAVSKIKGMAHITGGGLTDNLPRSLPDGKAARIRFGTWPVLPIFKPIVGLGGIASDEALKVFNMGVGFVLVVASEEAPKVQAALDKNGYDNYIIGEIVSGQQEVIYEGI